MIQTGFLGSKSRSSWSRITSLVRQEIKKIEKLAKVKDVSTFVQSGENYFVRDSKIGVVRC